MSILHFADTHKMVAFLFKPAESEGFQEIIDFLNENPINYALIVNPAIYTSCIEQFWATAKAKTVNGELQLQALVDRKKVIITETSIRRDLYLEDVEGTDCLPTATIFEELTRMGAKTTAWNEFSSTMASAIICLATNQKFNFSKYIFDNMVKHLEGGVKFLMYPRFVQVFINQQLGDMSHHKKIYVTPSHTKKIFANMKREGKDFSKRVTPLFPTIMVQAEQEKGEGSAMPTNPQHTPTTTHSSTSQPQKQKSKKSKKKNTEVPQLSGSPDDVADENVTQTFNDLLLSGEDRLQLTYVMDLCTKLSKRFIDLEHTKTTQAREITRLKLRVKKLEKKAGSRTHKLKRLYKFGATRRVESPKDEGLGDQEDASKQGRSIEDIDKDAEVTLVDETQERYDDLMFDTAVFDNEEVVTTTAKEVSTADQVTTAGSYYYCIAATKVCNVKATTTTTAPSTIFKAKSIAFREPTTRTTTTTVPSQKSKDKGKAIMIEPEVPLKKKEQVRLDEELARKLEAEELKAARLERKEDEKL
ncbi:hypothetical protein Tco_0735724 [Tanacetum coccineum]